MGMFQDYINNTPQAHLVSGKKCDVMEWGNLRVYFNKNKWAEFKRDAQTVYGQGKQWRLWRTSGYDQVEKFSALPAADKKKITKVSIEQFEDVVNVYQEREWSDVVEWCAYAIVNGYPVYLLVKNDDNAKTAMKAIMQIVVNEAQNE